MHVMILGEAGMIGKKLVSQLVENLKIYGQHIEKIGVSETLCMGSRPCG